MRKRLIGTRVHRDFAIGLTVVAALCIGLLAACGESGDGDAPDDPEPPVDGGTEAGAGGGAAAPPSDAGTGGGSGVCSPDSPPQAHPSFPFTPAGSGAHAVGGFIDGGGRVTAFGYGFRSGDPGDFVFAARLGADGAADPGYGDGGITRVWPLDFVYTAGVGAVPTGSDEIMLAAAVSTEPNRLNVALFRVTATGALDTAMGTGGFVNAYDDGVDWLSTVRRIALGVDGPSVYLFPDVHVSDALNPFDPGQDLLLGRRFDSNGQRDPSFDLGLVSGTTAHVRYRAGFVAVANFSSAWLLRDGMLDMGFGTSGEAHVGSYDDLLVRRSGSLLVAGSSLREFVGSQTETLLDLGVVQPEVVGIGERCDGRIILALAGNDSVAAALLTADNALDPSRGNGGIVEADLDPAFLSTSIVPVIDEATGRVTFVVKHSDEALHALPIDP